MLGYAPERFPSEPGGPCLREHMHALVARAIEAPPPSLGSPATRFTGHGSRSTLRGTREATQICGVQYSFPNQILIDIPKRLKIAATQTKQSSRVISNRYKNRGSCEARFAADPVAPDPSLPLKAGRPALSFRRVFVRHSISMPTQRAYFATQKIIRNAATD
jgi:hypothetical protein